MSMRTLKRLGIEKLDDPKFITIALSALVSTLLFAAASAALYVREGERLTATQKQTVLEKLEERSSAGDLSKASKRNILHDFETQ